MSFFWEGFPGSIIAEGDFFSGKVLAMRRRLFMNLMSSKDVLHLKATVPCCERCIFFDWGTRITIVDVLVRCHVCLPEPPSVRL